MKTIQRRGGQRWLYACIIILLLGGYTYWSQVRPLSPLKPQSSSSVLTVDSAAAKLAWPSTGQAAVGIAGTAIINTHNPQTPVPTASTAKLITALTVLRAKPLVSGQAGPTITLGAGDVAIYNSYATQDGSIAPVAAGEHITEYQMMEAMLLPSANNVADSLAIWAFGSLKAYSLAANTYLAQHGLLQTHVGTDASGFDPSTTSTAHDLARLGELAMANPVLARIVGQPAASGIPVAGTVKNVNYLLGTANIIGVKTGNTVQAGGAFVSASRVAVNGQPVTIVTALVGAATLAQAMKDSLPLIQSAQANLHTVAAIRAGSIVGYYQLPWGGNVPAIASRGLNTTAWNGSQLAVSVKLGNTLAGSQAGSIVGSITTPATGVAKPQLIDVKLQSPVTKPTRAWRLLHGF